MKDAMGNRTSTFRNGPRTLAIDVGGTGLKASVLDRAGQMLVDRVRVATPYPCPPKVLLRTLVALVAPLLGFDQISVGFPGVVRDGRTLTAPHFGDRPWRNFPLVATLSKRFGKPVRLLNDAEVQGFGIVKGRGLEVVPILGNGDKVINPPGDVRIASNHAGIAGGIRLWDAEVERYFFMGVAAAAGSCGRAPRPSDRNNKKMARGVATGRRD